MQLKPISRATRKRVVWLMNFLGHRGAARLLGLHLEELYEVLRGLPIRAGLRESLARRLDNLEKRDE